MKKLLASLLIVTMVLGLIPFGSFSSGVREVSALKEAETASLDLEDFSPVEDFEWKEEWPWNGAWHYVGDDKVVKVPHQLINGDRELVDVTTYRGMFAGKWVEDPETGDWFADSPMIEKVISTNPNITDISGMFASSQATSLDLSHFDTSNVTDMGGMFVGSQATSLDLSHFDTSNVTDMGGMFASSQATSLDLSHFDTLNVTDMSDMFAESQATSLDLSHFDTSNVTDMSQMFFNSQAISLDVSSFDTSNVMVMSGMFNNSQATELDLSSFETSKVTDMSRMFFNSQAKVLDLSSFNTSNVRDMASMFSGSQANELNLSSFETSKVTDMSWMFSGSLATTLDLNNFDTSNVTDMRAMFQISQATELDLSSFDTSNVTEMVAMFNHSQAAILDLSSFDTTNVTDMSAMFASSQATTLDLNNFDTSNVTDMNSMFSGSQAKTLNLSSFDTTNVTDMSAMFWRSQAATLDLSSFDTSNVTDMGWMFEESRATTGWARTQEDADRFNSSEGKPEALVFKVKGSSDVEPEPAKRTSGTNRYLTAYEIAKENNLNPDTVILVRGDDTGGVPQVVDGLTASGLAGARDAQILLTQPNRLTRATREALLSLRPKNVIIVGGEGAVGPEVVAALEGLDNDTDRLKLNIQRVSGTNRFATAAEVAMEIGSAKDNTAIIVNGTSEVDSLVAGPLAHQGYPILMVNNARGRIPQETQDAIKALGIENLLIVGGYGVVSQNLEAQLNGIDGVKVQARYGGSDRVETSILLAGHEAFEGSPRFSLVNGLSYVDAVAASTLRDPVIYILPRQGITETLKAFIGGKEGFRAIGGGGVITEELFESVEKLLKK